MSAARYLITGATGFLGREVLVRLLARGRPVMVLVRRRGEEDTIEAARARMLAIVEDTAPGAPIEGLDVAFGDVTAEGLGLGDRDGAWLLDREGGPVQIIHGAAQVRFDLPWDEMERQNLRGTENVLHLARQLADRGALARLDYVSTAFIAGDRRDMAGEHEIDVGQTPRNGYERSKLAAELAVDRDMQAGLRVAVHRPSIIVGDSRTGKTSSFKVLYWPMKVYARGRWRTVFARPACPLDIVPVDWVAGAMSHLLDEPRAIGRRIHLAAGPEAQSSIGEIAAIMQAELRQKPLRWIDPDVYRRWLRPVVRPLARLFRPDVADSGAVFLPYLAGNPTFSTAAARELLMPAGLAPPRVADYFTTIVRYARDTNFGRETSS